VDPYVEDDYFEALKKLYFTSKEGNCSISLMGIEPTYPSEKYGYIIPETKNLISNVLAFKEKPSENMAKQYIQEGALWNAGIFSFKIDYLLNKAHSLIRFKDYFDLVNVYDSLKKESFDYAVVENEKSINVLRFNGKWADLGTWNTLTESMTKQNLGNVIIGDKCKDNHVINTLDMPVFCMGIKRLIIVASPEGILVTDKAGSSKIKPYIDKLESPIMFAEKSWGDYRVMDVEQGSLTIRVTLKAGHHMSYHSHDRRDETWTIVDGTGWAIIDGKKEKVGPKSFISLKAGVKHSIIAESDIRIIEVQIGKDIDVKDKRKFAYSF
jgi:mannose-1-phosphate guanylyltransferase